MTITNYIKERIHAIKKAQITVNKNLLIAELQAVLSKIKELKEEERIQNIGEARAEDKW